MKYRHRLRVLRAERRISQMDLAAKVKIGINRYWRIENGYTDPSDSERERIARVLGAAIEDAFPEVAA